MDNTVILKERFSGYYATYIAPVELAASDKLPENHPHNLLARGMKLFREGEAVEGMDLMVKSAEKGNAFAAYTLGVCYIFSANKEDPESYEGMLTEGVEWLTFAASLGHDQAMVALAFFYMAEDCPYHSDKDTAKWFKRAAEAGNVEGMYEYGSCFLSGCGVKQDFLQSAFWLEKAANLGAPLAQFELAVQYSLGEGVAKNPQKAIELFRKAADQGHPGAMAGLAEHYYDGDGVKKDYAEAYLLYYRCYKAGNPKGNLGLAHFYLDNEVMPPDYQTALQLLSTDEAINYAPAQKLRTSILEQFTEHAGKNAPYALTQLGWAALNGVAFEGNKERAYHFISTAAKMAAPLARCLLRCYLNEYADPNAASIEECQAFYHSQIEYGVHWAARELLLMAMRGDYEATEDEVFNLYTKALELWDFAARDDFYSRESKEQNSEN